MYVCKREREMLRIDEIARGYVQRERKLERVVELDSRCQETPVQPFMQMKLSPS